MSGADLINDLQLLLQRINRAIDTLAANGKKLAEAERTYRVELAKQMLKMREAGMPVTLIGDMCRGDTQIADLKMARDTAEAVYNANLEAIQAWKLQCRLMESQISREWGRNDA